MAQGSLSARMDRLIAGLLYGGLFTLAVGLGSRGGHPLVTWGLAFLGAAAAAAGVYLLWVRSRLRRQAASATSPSEGLP